VIDEKHTEKRIVNKSVNILREKDCLVFQSLKEVFLGEQRTWKLYCVIGVLQALAHIHLHLKIRELLYSIVEPLLIQVLYFWIVQL